MLIVYTLLVILLVMQDESVLFIPLSDAGATPVTNYREKIY